jgi:hypothetical protein
VAEQKRVRDEQERLRRERGELEPHRDHDDLDEDTGEEALD